MLETATRQIEVHNPATGQVIASVPALSVDEVAGVADGPHRAR